MIDRKGIAKLIHELKADKAPGPDSLKKRDLLLVPQITNILASIFQYSVDAGTLPLIWKQANVVPIH